MIEFKIPKFANTDWELVIKEANKFDKILLPYFAKAIDVVKNFEEEANPQSLAWMIIWTHVFTTLQGAQAAAQKKSELSLYLLNRSCMELELIT